MRNFLLVIAPAATGAITLSLIFYMIMIVKSLVSQSSIVRLFTPSLHIPRFLRHDLETDFDRKKAEFNAEIYAQTQPLELTLQVVQKPGAGHFEKTHYMEFVWFQQTADVMHRRP